ncbi:hypothetical protein [Pseudoalteromonas sp. ZZD1]|uniref:hypothetical protein n=1 Tax=Pseudoalteromonas sp. ZZD1 TaxID=3139395 RepID=UPI003BAD9D28
MITSTFVKVFIANLGKTLLYEFEVVVVNRRLVELRKIVRTKSKTVIDTLLEDHSASICILCATGKDLTKEHVIPKWTFENNQNKNFVTGINGLSQSYSKTTLPACSHCNSYLMGALERNLELLFRHKDLSEQHFSNDEKSKIILWLEFIDYKFNALDLRRKLKKPKGGAYIPYLADFPVSIMQRMDDSPSKIFTLFRNSLKKLGVKSRVNQLNSLVTFKTTNESFHFFHQTSEYIFIELPQHSIALFYHFNQEFDVERDAYDSAMEIR